MNVNYPSCLYNVLYFGHFHILPLAFLTKLYSKNSCIGLYFVNCSKNAADALNLQFLQSDKFRDNSIHVLIHIKLITSVWGRWWYFYFKEKETDIYEQITTKW